jgi:hypothetical protein
MNIFAYIYLAAFILVLLIGVLALIKNEVTFKNSTLIDYAINLYITDMIEKAYEEACATGKDYDECYKPEVCFNDTEDYNATLKRLWDWGYTRILPPEKFEIIKPYIEKAKEELKNESAS